SGLVLGVVALVAATGYVVREVDTGKREERRREAEGRLFGVAPEDITAIAVVRPDESIRLERSAEGWRLLGPAAAKSDPGAAGGRGELRGLAPGGRVRGRSEAPPAGRGGYGFGPPATQVPGATRSGGPQEIEVGLEAPGEEGFYIRRSGSPAVLLAGADMRDL